MSVWSRPTTTSATRLFVGHSLSDTDYVGDRYRRMSSTSSFGRLGSVTSECSGASVSRSRCRSFVHQAIAYARLGQQVARSSGVSLDLAAELAEVHAKVLVLFHAIGPPDFLQQLS